MTVSEFKSCTKNPHPRKEWPLHIKALWHDARGDWEKAHTIIENTIELSSSWVHAYLHRKEGDQWNAEFWYRQAGKPVPNCSITEEWSNIASSYFSIA